MEEVARISWRAILIFLAAMGCTLLTGNAAEMRASAVSAKARNANASGLAKVEAPFFEAIAKGERKTAEAYLDTDFEWTNADGETVTRAEAVRDLDALRRPEPEEEVREYDYDGIVVISGVHQQAHFMRVWGKRPAGWRAVVFIDTPISKGTAPFSVAVQQNLGDCDNPCRTMPYQPRSTENQEIAAIFERLKMDEWHPNPEDWAPYVLDGVNYVTSAASLSKEARVAHLEEMKEKGTVAVPGDPVQSMRILDFDNAAVMIAVHAPYLGGKPYRSVRCWAFRDGRWQLANSQQTTMSEAKEVPSFAPKR
jgi:hypothetical protein